jgi:putative oxidoreductase
MKDKVMLGIQVLAGVMLVVFGLNKFLHFIPMAQPAPEMGAYLGALAATGFLFPLIAVIEIAAGIAFLINKFVPLLVLFVTPVMLNAFLAHLFLDPAGIGGSAFIMAALFVIIFRHRERFKEVLCA